MSYAAAWRVPAGSRLAGAARGRRTAQQTEEGEHRYVIPTVIPLGQQLTLPLPLCSDVDEMFATPEDSGQHWLQMTINDDWERAPEGPDMAEPADLNLAK